MKRRYSFPDMLFDPSPVDDTETRLERLINEVLTAKHLRIDQHILELRQHGRLHKRWNNFSWDFNLKYIGRRTLEIALNNAGFAAEDVKKTGHIAEWECLTRDAERASEAFNLLLKSFSGNKLSLGARALQQPLRQMAVQTTRLDAEARIEWAREQADKLLEMQALLKDLSGFTAGMRSGLAIDHKNPGRPIKAAFVQTLAEGWIYLTGKLPGGGSESEKNPFLRFVESAWEDAGGEKEESFVQSLRTTLPLLKENQLILADGYKPSGFEG